MLKMKIINLSLKEMIIILIISCLAIIMIEDIEAVNCFEVSPYIINVTEPCYMNLSDSLTKACYYDNLSYGTTICSMIYSSIYDETKVSRDYMQIKKEYKNTTSDIFIKKEYGTREKIKEINNTIIEYRNITNIKYVDKNISVPYNVTIEKIITEYRTPTWIIILLSLMVLILAIILFYTLKNYF